MNENFDLFQRAAFPDRLCFLLQDQNYLKWRIAENPYPVKYRSFQLVNKENILMAQVIFSTSFNTAFIEQILFDRKLKMKTIYWLLKKVIKSLKQEKIYLVRYIGFKNNFLNNNEIKIVENIGFVYTRKGEQVSFVTLSEDHLINPENVYLSRSYKQGVNWFLQLVWGGGETIKYNFMNNLERYNKAFIETFDVTEPELAKLTYQSVALWDSIGHMALITELEEAFNIMIETDDIIDFNSYKKGFEILKKYGISL